MKNPTIKPHAIKRVDKVIYHRKSQLKRTLSHDSVISEQPLSINLHWHLKDDNVETKVFAITMRTLGDDNFLILGLLFSEGIIRNVSDVECIYLDEINEQSNQNTWHVLLIKGMEPKLTSIERFQTTYSSCGLCGATSLQALELKEPPNLVSLSQNFKINADLLFSLTDNMRDQQSLFALTGGVHGAALFDKGGKLINVFEDIGRHNAVDKLIGHCLFNKLLNTTNQSLTMVVSGRVSFEIVQKVVMAGICILVSVGAPSDLAIKAAQRFDLTLIGFVTSSSFNVYCGDWRVNA